MHGHLLKCSKVSEHDLLMNNRSLVKCNIFYIFLQEKIASSSLGCYQIESSPGSLQLNVWFSTVAHRFLCQNLQPITYSHLIWIAFQLEKKKKKHSNVAEKSNNQW